MSAGSDTPKTTMNRPHALITGASSGIGLELARVFAGKGYDLTLVARDRARLEALAGEVRAKHGATVAVEPCDLANAADLDGLLSRLSGSTKNVDVLVNNAGGGVEGKFIETDWALERAMLDVNVVALVRLTKAFLPAMVKRGSGKVLLVASTAAFQPGPYLALYFASKSFVLSFSEAVSEEIRGSGVTVTALCPGATLTEFERRLGTDSRIFSSGLPVSSPAAVADFAFASLMRGKRVAIHGIANHLLYFVARISPRFLTLRLMTWIIGRHRGSRPAQAENFASPQPLVTPEPRDRL